MKLRPAAILAVLIAVAGCSIGNRNDALATATAANGTLSATIAGAPDLRTLAAALADTQLAPVLDGPGDYTLLAPTDAAFAALGSEGRELAGVAQRPRMIAVLRAHILPGQVTPQAIEQAIARRQGAVEMRTMAGDTVRFARGKQGIEVTNGTVTARLAAGAQTASNGAVLPIDRLLLPAPQ